MKLLMVLFVLLVSRNVMSQNDSLKYFPDNKSHTDNTHKLKLAQMIAPVLCVGAGVVGIGNDWVESQDNIIRDGLKGNNKLTIDNYMQYVPTASVYLLNLCGVKGRHDFIDRTVILGMSWLMMGMITNTMKLSIGERRPDGSSRNSFPSGHTATAFMGAEFLYQEYKDVSPWIGISGYLVASTTGFFRMYNNRHWLDDVIEGAGVGMLSTKLAYWLYPRIFKGAHCQKRNYNAQFVAMPYYNGHDMGCSAYVNF